MASEDFTIGGYRISRTDFPIGNGSPCYQLVAFDSPTGLPCLWADTQIGAAACALGAAYVQACLDNDPQKFAATQTAITEFLANLR